MHSLATERSQKCIGMWWCNRERVSNGPGSFAEESESACVQWDTDRRLLRLPADCRQGIIVTADITITDWADMSRCFGSLRPGNGCYLLDHLQSTLWAVHFGKDPLRTPLSLQRQGSDNLTVSYLYAKLWLWVKRSPLWVLSARN